MNNRSNLFASRIHHSVGDWDKPATDWKLDTDFFVSPPSSLYSWNTTPQAFLCRLADSLCLPTGRIVSWIRPQFQTAYWLTFRNQVALGSSDLKDCYLIATSSYTRVDFGKRVNNVYTKLDEWLMSWSLATWIQVRVTWWTTYDAQNQPTMAVHLEAYEGGAWVDKGTLYDSDNLWSTSTVNRLGLAVTTGGISFDDTEIWKPTE